MEKYLALLQNLQDTYSSQCGMCLMIADNQGEFQTRPSGRVEWLEWVGVSPEAGRLPEDMLNSVERFEPLNRTVDIEYAPGLKYMVAPIVLDRFAKLYLIAGFFTEARSKRLLDQYYIDREQDRPGEKQLRESVQALNGEQKSALSEKLGTMAQISAGLLTGRMEQKWSRHQMGIVREIASLIESPDTRIKDILQLYFRAQKGLDFLGFASRLDDTRFQVAELLGEPAVALMGATFSLGEGLLGQSGTMRQTGVWENIANDPRTLFFTQHNIHPQALVCFPVMQDFSMTGLIFGGSISQPAIPEEAVDLGHAIISLLGTQASFRSLRDDRNKYHLRLNMLVEICRTFVTVQDIKRILFILVDMSLNLVQGPFACVVLANPNGRAQTVCRGLSKEKVGLYAKELSNRYEGGGDKGLHRPESAIVEFLEEPVIELPLVDNGEFVGVLAIGLKSPSDADEYKDFLRTLAIAGSAAIRRIKEEQLNQGPNTAVLLHRFIGQWDPVMYEIAASAQELGVGFAKARMLSAADIQDVADACLIASYQTDLLKEVVRRPSLMKVITELQELLTPGTEESFAESTQIVALALEQASIDRASEPVRARTVKPELREQFASYVTSREVVDLELHVGDSDVQSREGGRSDPMQAIRELTALSSREQEVLSLVALGSSNREIAEKLFISEHTVKNHMTNIFQKLGVTDRSQLIAMVYQLGYGQP